MKKQILILVLGMFLISFTSAYQTYYKLDLNYSRGNINISNLDIEFSENLIDNYPGDYSAEVVGFGEEILNLTFFGVPNKILWDGIDEETGEISFGGEGELDEVEFEIYVPYYENAKEIIIYDENLDEIAKIDVSMYSKDYEKVPEIIESEAINEEEKVTQPKETTPKEKVDYIELAKKYWWILVIVFVILFLKLIWDLSSRSRKT